MLYSSLLKCGMTNISDEKTCIVNSNEIIAKKLEEFHRNNKEQSKGGFKAGLHAPELELVENIEENENLEAILNETPQVLGPDPEELLAEAREKIAVMEEEAKAALETERKRVLEESRREGYSKGFEEGQRQGQAQAEVMKRELEAVKADLEAKYQHQLNELEPQFIDTLTGIYEHLFNVEIGENRDVIVHLITSAMNNIDGARDYLVHVSKDDFAYVNMHKKEIQDNSMMGNSTMEIIEDISLRKNECLIETDGGIFDCGLGTQLSELTKKLKLLSYEKE